MLSLASQDPLAPLGLLAVWAPAQALGFLGAALNIVWPWMPGRRSMLVGQIGVSVCFGLHYLLLDAMTGAWMNVLAVAQALFAIPLGTRPGFRLAYLATLPIIASLLALSWQGSSSALAAAGMALISLGRYQLDPLRFRALFLLAVLPWFAHNLLVGSVAGMVADACAFSAGSIAFWRAWERRTPNTSGST